MEASFCGANQGELQNKHFNTEHFEKAGRSLFHALIVYDQIDVDAKADSMKLKKFDELPEAPWRDTSYDAVLEEMLQKPEEEQAALEESSEGSDSEPSEDNLSDDEMEKLIP